MVRKLLKHSFIIIAGTLVICVGLVYFFFFTTPGGCFVIRKALSGFTKSKSVEFREARGSIIRKMTLENIQIKESSGLPKGSMVIIKRADIWLTKFSKVGLRLKVQILIEDIEIVLQGIPNGQVKIQKAEIEFTTRNISTMKIKVSNGRLSLPSSDTILFYGDYAGEALNFNMYSKNVAIDSLTPFFAFEKPLVFVKGSLEDVDLFCSGTMHEPVIKGTALIGKIDYQSFSLRNTPLAYDIALKTKSVPAQVNGTVHVKQGQVIGPGAVSVQLEESWVSFSGDYSKPSFDIKGSSSVEKTKIRIVIKGTSDKPELKLSSEPPLPQEQLLVMLVTGKKWSGVDTVFSQGAVSPDLAMDFIDYFVLGGAGSKIASQFGITGFSVTLDKEKKGVEVKKSVTDKVEVGYGVLQTQSQERAQETTQKVSGELKVTDAISVGAEKELKQQDTSGKTLEKQKTDDKVMIKFKKNF